MAENIEALKIAAKSNKVRVEQLQAALAAAVERAEAAEQGEVRIHLLLDDANIFKHHRLYVRIEHLVRTWGRQLRAWRSGAEQAEAALAAAVERAEAAEKLLEKKHYAYQEAVAAEREKARRAGEFADRKAQEVRHLRTQIDSYRERPAVQRAEAAEQEAEALRGDVNALIEKLHRHWDGMYGRSMDELDTPAAIDTLTPARKKAADLAMRATYELMHQLDGTENDYVKGALHDHT